MTSLKPYSAYSDSDVDWLPTTPSGWKTMRGKWLFKKQERSIRDTDEVITCFRDGVVTLRKNRRTTGFTESLKEIGYQGIRKGDLVIHAMDAFAGAVGVADADGKGTPVYAVCSPASTVSAYYYALVVREMARSQWILALAKGIRERSTDFRYSTFAALTFPLPPLPEQEAIVRFLDYVDRRVQRYIDAKQKLITLLEEQKQAIIHQAVTRGLDPNVPLKPSGVEWLGDIPAHWVVKRLKATADIRYGLGQPPREASDGLPLIRATNVERGRIVEKDLVFVDPSDVPRSRNAVLRMGEIVVVRSGAYTADSAIVPVDYEGSIAGYDMVVTVNEAQPDFVAQALLCSYVLNDQLIVASMRSAQPHLNSDELGVAQIVLPPLSEQAAVVEHLRRGVSAIEAAHDRAHREIDLLLEYLHSLNADVVTGKLDVREAASALPDEPADSELFLDSADVDQADELLGDLIENVMGGPQ